jgi:prepilin-type N-terminal cleavage/methylation domain-containing protein
MTKETLNRLRGRSQPGFTLIELLVVMAVIALLAAMIMPITGAVSRNKIRTRARVEMARIQAAIESYKSKLGHYPPDSTPPDGASNSGYSAATNQLYYELAGTVATPFGKGIRYTTLDGSETIDSPDISFFFRVEGFINCTKGGSSDEAPPAENFIPGLRPDQTAEVLVGGKGSPLKLRLLVGYPWKAIPNSLFTQPTGLNPWRYRSRTTKQRPTLNNPDSYDLWLDVNIGGNVYRICNWSQQPLKVSNSLDN